MAQQTIVTLTDDIDGSDATETVSFGLNGRVDEIDLNEAHADDHREIVAPYIGAAQSTGRPSGARRTSGPSRAAAEVDLKAVPGGQDGDGQDGLTTAAWCGSGRGRWGKG